MSQDPVETAASRLPLSFRRRIEPWQFEACFDPRQLRKEACLLSEVRWGASPRTWRESCLNTARHVERNFIDKFASERRLQPSVRCSVTWFLSWSPCWECAGAVRAFLAQHPNVTLVIRVARLFWHMEEQNRRGLGELLASGVRLQVMSESGNSSREGASREPGWRLPVQMGAGRPRQCDSSPRCLHGPQVALFPGARDGGRDFVRAVQALCPGAPHPEPQQS